MAAIAHASLRRQVPMGDHELFEILKPPLRVTLSLIYFYAGFHKLTRTSSTPKQSANGVRALESLPSRVEPVENVGLQGDLVEIIAIDPRHVRNSRNSRERHLLPVVEFKKRIHVWRGRGLDGLQATFEYRGRLYRTDDLVRDNPWDLGGRDLEMFLLDLRPVQKGATPNRCRW